MQLLATTPGIYPLPDDAKETLGDLKGHQRGDMIDGDEDEAVQSVYEDVRADLIGTQSAAGLDLVVEGQARWDDMLAHPLAVHDAVETGGIVRYYDNNNFYRDPVVTGELTPDGDMAADLEAAAALTEDLQAVTPGPYTLAELATNEYYEDDAAFLAAVTDFLVDEVEAFPSSVETLFVLEPSLVSDPPEEGVDERASEAIDSLADAIDAPVVVQTYWGALDERVHAHLLDADVDAIGYDLVADHEASIDLIAEYGTKDDIALGVVDGQNTLVEDPETLLDRVEWVDQQTPDAQDFETVYLTANTELFYLPVNRFEEKLDALATAADRGVSR